MGDSPASASACGPPFNVRRVSAAETVEVRWPILRAGLARESAVFPGDELPTTCHWGAHDEAGRVIGVVTILRVAKPDVSALVPESVHHSWQLRGMAVLHQWQGRGVGRALVAACASEVRREGGAGAVIWCYARSPAAPFYEKEGFVKLGAEFEIPTAGPHFVMWRFA